MMNILGTDLYNFQITGDKACSMNANSNMSANHAGPALLILNDMGGDIMSVSKDVTCTLRSQMKHHEPIICFEPGIAKREGSDSRFVADKSVTLRANMGDNQPAVVYAIEGNVVDRVSSKNGKGYCENVSPTLNTQDRHAIVYALEGNGARPSHMGTGFNDSGVMYTLNTIEQHSVCYENSCGGGYCAMKDRTAVQTQKQRSQFRQADQMTTTSQQCATCYGVDCRNLCVNEEKSGTLQAKNVGGFSYNFLNPVLMVNDEQRED